MNIIRFSPQFRTQHHGFDRNSETGTEEERTQGQNYAGRRKPSRHMPPKNNPCSRAKTDTPEKSMHPSERKPTPPKKRGIDPQQQTGSPLPVQENPGAGATQRPAGRCRSGMALRDGAAFLRDRGGPFLSRNGTGVQKCLSCGVRSGRWLEGGAAIPFPFCRGVGVFVRYV
jgi:hypothetical protein